MGMSKFDQWLTHDPRGEVDALFERFCEEHGYAFDDPAAERAFEDWMETNREPDL